LDDLGDHLFKSKTILATKNEMSSIDILRTRKKKEK